MTETLLYYSKPETETIGSKAVQAPNGGHKFHLYLSVSFVIFSGGMLEVYIGA